jgi:hypothetical protein
LSPRAMRFVVPRRRGLSLMRNVSLRASRRRGAAATLRRRNATIAPQSLFAAQSGAVARFRRCRQRRFVLFSLRPESRSLSDGFAKPFSRKGLRSFISLPRSCGTRFAFFVGIDLKSPTTERAA